MKYSLAELVLANDLATPDVMRELFQKHWLDTRYPDDWMDMYGTWLVAHDRNLLTFMFRYSRNDLKMLLTGDMTLEGYFNMILTDLLH